MSAEQAIPSDRIDETKVRAIAELARLALTDTEVASFSQQFTAIIEYFHLLDDASVADVPPAYLLNVREDTMRADEPGTCIDREEFLSQAPVRAGERIKVAPVINAED